MEVKKSNTTILKTNSKLFSKDTRLEKFVVALFDYDPNKDSQRPARGLPFSFGDILHVTNATDSQWWYAQHVFSINHVNDTEVPSITQCNQIECSGIIPSTKLVNKRDQLRNKKVNFSSKNLVGDKLVESYIPQEMASKDDYTIRYNNPKEDKGKKLSLFSKYFAGKSKSLADKEYSASLENINKNLSFVYYGSDAMAISKDSLDRSYLEVERIHVDANIRPVVILGPLHERLIEDVLRIDSSFAFCPFHTTNSVDPNSTNLIGCKDFAAMQLSGGFIEVSDRHGSFYGLHSSTISQILNKNKVPVLNISIVGVKRLKTFNNSPIVILAMPESEEVLRKTMPELDAVALKDHMAQCNLIYEQDWEHLTSAYKFKSYNSCLYKLKYTLAFHLKSNLWLPKRKKSQLESLNMNNLAK